jgi:hypothetical protein
MLHRVFTQFPASGAESAAFENNADRYFVASLRTTQSGDGALRAELASRRGTEGAFTLLKRARSPQDVDAARAAETRGRAAGMAALAERCPEVWLVEPDAGTSEAATLLMCAVIASVALGPVLPPDESTLFGVRGAMERRERLLDPPR